MLQEKKVLIVHYNNVYDINNDRIKYVVVMWCFEMKEEIEKYVSTNNNKTPVHYHNINYLIKLSVWLQYAY